MIKTVWCVTPCASNLKRAAEFYEETLGLEKKYEYSSYVGFECGGVETGLIPRPERAQNMSPTLRRVEFLVEDADSTYGKLEAKGARFIEELHDEVWGGKQAAFADLDSNVLEIAQIHSERYVGVSARGVKKSRETR